MEFDTKRGGVAAAAFLLACAAHAAEPAYAPSAELLARGPEAQSTSRYRYGALDSNFVREIEVDRDGLVVILYRRVGSDAAMSAPP